MTSDELQREIERMAERARMLGDLHDAGLHPFVQFIDGETFFLHDDVGWLSTRRAFRKFFGTPERLDNYYIGGTGNLAVKYRYGASSIVMFFTNVEEMLYKLTKGTCHVVTKTEPKTDSYIACEVQ